MHLINGCRFCRDGVVVTAISGEDFRSSRKESVSMEGKEAAKRMKCWGGRGVCWIESGLIQSRHNLITWADDD